MSRAVPRFRRVNPPLPAFPGQNLFQLIVGGTADNEQWQFALAYMGPDTLTANSEANIAQTFDTNVHSFIQGITDSSVLFNYIKVTCLNIPSRMGTTRLVNGGVGWAGTVGATHLPKEMAGIISKTTFVKGQHGRGRNYMPPVPVTFTTPATNPNLLNATGLVAYNLLAQAMQNVAIADGAQQMFLAIYTRVPKGAPVVQATTVQSAFARSVLGTVRRRRPGRGK